MRLCVAFDTLGPYHVARLGAAARDGEVVALERTAVSSTYGWDRTDGDDTGNLCFYRACGFRLAAAVPDGWGPGWIKAIMRRQLADDG